MGPRTFRFEPVPQERILGLAVHPVSKEWAVEAVVDRALGPETGAYVCLTNVHTTVESRNSAELRDAVDQAFLSVPDGMPLAWILKNRGYRQTEQVAGIDYVPMVARAGLELGLRHYLYGGSPEVASQAGRRLERLVPGVQIVGSASPPFAPTGRWPVDDLQRELRRTRPHILWVGLGAPKQELWMNRMAGQLDVPVMIGVGAVFDYLAGTKPAAPSIMRRVGLDWLFRLAVEPRRLWRRYLLGNSTFTFLLVRDVLARRWAAMASRAQGESDRSNTDSSAR
jgi:N-acetylglucosaminyldiphosphoundecaprenol N-acetyl-beta-D-mannosaminyltransferase